MIDGGSIEFIRHKLSQSFQTLMFLKARKSNKQVSQYHTRFYATLL